MMDTKPAQQAPRTPLNPFTLLAATALAFTNLLVGLLQNNSFLILASAILAAAFAGVYSHKIGLISIGGSPDAPTEAPETVAVDDTPGPSRKFPLWLFVGTLFVLMPLVLLFLQYANPE